MLKYAWSKYIKIIIDNSELWEDRFSMCNILNIQNKEEQENKVESCVKISVQIKPLWW